MEECVKHFTSIVEAELAKNLLAGEGIVAIVKNKGVTFAGDLGDSFGANLFVAKKNAIKAKKILG